MKTYDVCCPACGTVNRDLYLEETEGWMECERCHQVIQIPAFARSRRVPVYTGKQLAEKMIAEGK
mgnify:FL=1